MSVATLSAATVLAQEAPARAVMTDTQHDPHIYMTVGRMLDFCNQRPMHEPFTARGIVIDTTADIAGQLREFFPSHIDLSALIDRMTEVCMDRARATGQYLQILSFDHLKQIKPIDSDTGNMDTFVEVFADRRVKISQYTGIKTALKAGAGGGSGGDPHQMLAELRQADIQGFALQVKTLDIQDAKSAELLGKMAIGMAFGGDAGAIAGAVEAIKAGTDAKTIQAIVEQVVEVKTLRTALQNAPDVAAAQPIAAALAMKTEGLSAQVQTLQIATPQAATAIRANIAQTVEGIKTTLTAHQIEVAVTQLSTALPASMIRVANDLGRNTMSVQVARAVAAVQTIARTNNMSVRDIVTLVMTKNATPSMTGAVASLATLMAKPEFLPTIEKGVPARVALSVREALTVPALQSIAATSIPVATIARAAQALADKSDVPTVKMAAAVLSHAGQQIAAESISPALRAPQLQAVVENLQAVAMTSAMPAAMKPELATLVAQVQTLSVQMRAPEAAPLPTVMAPQAPLMALAAAVSVTPPQILPAPLPAIAELRGAPNHWGESPNASSSRMTVTTPQDAGVAPRADNTNTTTPQAADTARAAARVEFKVEDVAPPATGRVDVKGPDAPAADTSKADAPKNETPKTDTPKDTPRNDQLPPEPAPPVEARTKVEIVMDAPRAPDAPRATEIPAEAPKGAAPAGDTTSQQTKTEPRVQNDTVGEKVRGGGEQQRQPEDRTERRVDDTTTRKADTTGYDPTKTSTGTDTTAPIKFVEKDTIGGPVTGKGSGVDHLAGGIPGAKKEDPKNPGPGDKPEEGGPCKICFNQCAGCAKAAPSAEASLGDRVSVLFRPSTPKP